MENIGGLNITIQADNQKLINAVEQSKKILDSAFDTLKSKASGFGSKVSGAFASVAKGIGQFSQISQVANTSAASVFDTVGGLISKLAPLSTTLQNLKNSGSKGFEAIGAAVGKLDLSFADLLTPLGLAQTAIQVLTTLAIENFDYLTGVIARVINGFIDLYNNSLTVRLGIEGLRLTFVAIWETAKLVFKNLLEGFSTIGKVIKAAFRGDFSSIGDIIKEGFANSVENVRETAMTVGASAAEGLTSAVTRKLNEVSQEDVAGFLNRFIDFGTTAGTNAGAAVVESFKSAVEGVSSISGSSLPTSVQSDTAPSIDEGDTGQFIDFAIYDKALEKISLIRKEQQLFGDDIKGNAEATKVWEDAISSLLEKGFSVASPQIQFMADQMKELQADIRGTAVDLNEVLGSALDDFGVKVSEAILSATSVGDGLQKSFFGIFDVLSSVMAQLGKTAIQAGLGIEAIKNSFVSFSGIGAIAIGGALLVFSSLIKNTLASVPPALASGGLAYGETLALVGDNKNASVDPEVIAPLSKLKGMLDNGGGTQKLTATIRGDQILLISERAEITRHAVTGR